MKTWSGSSLAATAVLLAVWLALAPGCGRRVEHPDKVIFLGIDAADWKLITPLLDRGKLPNFARLMAEGATGPLLTLRPLEKSPIVWTSIATGKVPYKHGIGGFLAPGDSIPYTGNVRKVKAIWNILGEKGMKVGVVGWLVTWPAEEVNGYLVSDYVQYENEKGIKLEKQTYPEDLFREIDGLRLTEADVSDDAIAGLFPVNAPADALGGQEWLKGYVKMVYAQDETFRRIAMNLAGRDVKFLTVYFEGIDSLCHAAWGFRGQPTSPLSHLIDDYYVWIDGVLGQFMEKVDDRTLLVVASDHGFRGPWHTEDGALLLGVDMHDYYGIAGFMGRNVRKGVGIPEANVLDLTPTILYALGFPVARDMDGNVMTDIFDARFLRSNPVRFVKTYETGPARTGEPLKSPVDGKVRGKLKALGYIQ
jgi:predicted AlkP superfamily phosphohydrolase/phosphomutase